MKQEIESLKQQIEVLNRKPAPVTVPKEPSLRSGSPQSRNRKIVYVPAAQSRPIAAAAAAAAPAGTGIAHENRNFARELRLTVDLGGQHALSCSRIDEIRPSRSTFDLSDI